jgi:hypothetical protein
MKQKPRKHVIPQMFDVRPVDRSGSLDWERIGSVGSLRKIEYGHTPHSAGEEPIVAKSSDVFTEENDEVPTLRPSKYPWETESTHTKDDAPAQKQPVLDSDWSDREIQSTPFTSSNIITPHGASFGRVDVEKSVHVPDVVNRTGVSREFGSDDGRPSDGNSVVTAWSGHDVKESDDRQLSKEDTYKPLSYSDVRVKESLTPEAVMWDTVSDLDSSSLFTETERAYEALTDEEKAFFRPRFIERECSDVEGLRPLASDRRHITYFDETNSRFQQPLPELPILARDLPTPHVFANPYLSELIPEKPHQATRGISDAHEYEEPVDDLAEIRGSISFIEDGDNNEKPQDELTEGSEILSDDRSSEYADEDSASYVDIGWASKTFEDESSDSEEAESPPAFNLIDEIARLIAVIRMPSFPNRLHLAPIVIPSGLVRSASFLSVFLVVLFGGIWSVQKIFSMKNDVMKGGVAGISFASRAVDDLTAADFKGSARNFDEAYQTFSETSSSLGVLGNELAKATRFVPGLSKVSSGQGLLEGAKHLSSAGASLSRMLTLLPSSSSDTGLKDGTSFLDLIDQAEQESIVVAKDIDAAQAAFERVKPEDVPDDQRETFLSMKEKLPVISAALDGFNGNSHLVRELLGANGSRLYLFLFQNNAELRPTGGFIGSYGLLEVNSGHVRKFFVDGIFNPDGQLKENIIPPKPIQKVSTAWSLHDSNWWPDFPTSAEKAVFFYEKTGGPTVDGVITLTPTVIQELLRLTGPIDMPEYGVTIDADNFLPVVQEEVEENYDRELNQPKKILSDLAPIMLDRLFSMRNVAGLKSLADTLSRALGEKQVLLYSRNVDVESLIDTAGWSGRMLATPRDYLSVIHTNLNGYKTDAVIEESIDHSAVVQGDGTVLDTVRITRKHTGGNTPYDWFNRVNSDYMRVYVPEGSELVSASGQTYEFPKAPVDYEALGFRGDPDIERDEGMTRADAGGTRVSMESHKTVFGNWVYVSPGESVTVEYVYRLPFRVSPQSADPASYSVLFQKQPGTKESVIHSRLNVPDRYRPDWKSADLNGGLGGYSFESTLSTDRYYGAVFSTE